MKDSFEIPKKLQLLIDQKRWPSSLNSNQQILSKQISLTDLKKVFPTENEIHFHYPPFKTIQEEMKDSDLKKYYTEFGALDQIQMQNTLVIGEFETGADTTLILDYSESKTRPSVKKLMWRDKEHPTNYWRKVSNTFNEFLEELKINVV